MAEIPGYWRDPDTGRYFKIGDGFTPPKPKPKTLAELHPINYKPINRNTSRHEIKHDITYTLTYVGYVNLCLEGSKRYLHQK